jgi:hypothetical protein
MYFMEGRNLKNLLKHVGKSQINWCPLRKVAKKHGIKGVKTLHATLLDVTM